MTEFAKDMVYPPVCPVCGDIIPAYKRIDHYKAVTGHGKRITESYICDGCISELQFNTKKYCRKCGRPLMDTGDIEGGTCTDCRKRKWNFESSRSAFVYNDIARELLSDLKYNGRRDISDALSLLSYETESEWISQIKPDIIVPVPIHEKRRKIRGYNQAEVLAQIISEQAGVKLFCNALIRTRNTKALKELSPGERRKNLEDAFAPGCRFINHPTVLLIDDIFTTGATADSCAKTLLSMGAGKVYVLTIAGGNTYSQTFENLL